MNPKCPQCHEESFGGEKVLLCCNPACSLYGMEFPRELFGRLRIEPRPCECEEIQGIPLPRCRFCRQTIEELKRDLDLAHAEIRRLHEALHL